MQNAEKLCNGHARAHPISLDVADDSHAALLDSEVAKHDVIISLIPYTHHVTVIKSAIKHKKHVVTTSYISPAMADLDQQAKDAGITVMNEIGVDPGIDHLYALKTIEEVHEDGGKIVHFTSYCGGLPAPEDSANPLGYKFSWSSRGVLLALRNPAKYIGNGKVVDIKSTDLMDEAKPIFTGFPGFAFEGYPNRDSTPYDMRYNIPEAQTIIRGTLRYAGFPKFVKALVLMGMLDDDAKDYLKPGSKIAWVRFLAGLINCKRDVMQKVLNTANNDEETLGEAAANVANLSGSEKERVLVGLKWLGLFSASPVQPRGNLLDTLCATLEEKMQYGPTERDMVFLQHRFGVELKDGSKQTRTSTGLWYGEPNGVSAMAKTVGVPCGIATQLVLDGAITRKGVIAPMTRDVWEPLLNGCEAEKIGMVDEIL